MTPFANEDLPLVGRFQPEGWPELSPQFAAYLESSFCHPFKMLLDGEIAGLGAATFFGDTAWLGHIIVDPDKRNRGLGAFIVRELCEFCRIRNFRSILLAATDQGYPVYKKAGFRVQAEYVFFERTEKESRELPEGPEAARPDDFEAILALDRLITGENRAVLLGRFAADAFVVRSGSGLSGFYLPGLREGPVVARDGRAGEELLRLRAFRTAEAVVPADNQRALGFYRENAYTEKRRARRMILGEAPDWQPEGIFNRISGNFG